MDFFHQQDLARKCSRWMIFLFTVSVICIVAAVAGLAFLIVKQQIMTPKSSEDFMVGIEFVAGAGFITLLVILFGSWVRCVTLRRGGGKAVAESLGGRLVTQGTTQNLKEMQFLNIVEEMALASGLPVPPAYILDDETSINAFAAGNTPEDAVVAVTHGCLMSLDREELQGVIGHEFSHILNGDMNLNIRLMGVVYGISLIYLIGWFFFRVALNGSGSHDKDDKGGGSLALLSLAVMLIGLIGIFFGNVIKAALSRQREYLADASAVQFTRNPHGIANALKKIGGFKSRNQKMNSPNAAEASHLFFSEFSSSFLGWIFSTHPPLSKRIARLDPNFNHELAEVLKVTQLQDVAQGICRPTSSQTAGFSSLSGFGQSVAQAYNLADGALTRTLQAKQQGRGPRALPKEKELVPPPLPISQAIANSQSACAYVLALLTDRENAETAAIQEKIVAGVFEGSLVKDWLWLKEEISRMTPSQRLMHLKMAVSSLHQLSHGQYISFQKVGYEMIYADQVVDFNEFLIYSMVFRQLNLVFGLSKPSDCTKQMTLRAFRNSVLILSRLAYAGSDEPEEQKYAFRTGLQFLHVADADILPREACSNQELQRALDELDQLRVSWKRKFLDACSLVINADGVLTEEEAFLQYGIAAALGIYAQPE